MAHKSLEELIAEAQHKRTRKPARDDEHQLQAACVRWFAYEYPNLRGLLFAVPNGGRRDITTGARLKAEGVVAGVSDLILFMPSDSYHALCIEMKTKLGKQSSGQKRWQRLVESVGYKYVVCHSFDEFSEAIKNYLIYGK